MSVRVTGPMRYAVQTREGDALVMQVKAAVGNGYTWRCYFCKGHPAICAHVSAVREFRRQAYIEDDGS
ncbi:MAG: hypothetical protein ACYC28_16165 [Longimicrobiales bacterium]